MATKSPLQKLQHTVVGTVKAITHPVGTAGKAVEQARGTVSLGRTVAGQVGKTAVGAVTSRLGHGGPATPAKVQEVVPESPASLRSVPETPVTQTPPAKKPAAKKAPAKNAPAKKAPPKKAPATTKSTTPTRSPVTDVATELVKEQAAHQPVQEAPPAPESPIDAAAAAVEVEATPADVAKKVAKKAPAKKAATKAAAKKTPPRKTAKKSAPRPSTPSAKLPARKSASAPKTAAELIEDADLPSPIDSIGSSTATDAEQG
ncbi:MAG TPA: hypothetical protein VFT70_05000 [Nocardioides sp.]|nr:hypothetical protein [Nocardioides sp.]